MTQPYKTNICCFDLTQECINYLESLDFNVYEGSLGSVLSFDWNKIRFRTAQVLNDDDIPRNLQEYHVFVADLSNAHQKEYESSKHEIQEVKDASVRTLICRSPVSVLDIRPFGSFKLSMQFDKLPQQKRIEVVFVGSRNEVHYTTDTISGYDPESLGTFNNYEVWNIVNGIDCCGRRVSLVDNWMSKALFEGREDRIKYYRTFFQPQQRKGSEQIPDPAFLPLLYNEDGDCVSYLYAADNKRIRFVLPVVADKAALLKALFEDVLFEVCSEFFPDIESHRWINLSQYQLPEEIQIRQTIQQRKEEFQEEIESLEREVQVIGEKHSFLKALLTESGSRLVAAVKTYLEWLGFVGVVDKDETLKSGELKEEDLCLEYADHLVLVEVKGINGTSTDAECSQIDKVVARRMRQLDRTQVHGIYIVNHQKNIEPLKRKTPPFNETQVKDAESQLRTMAYTTQLFALYSDIENGIITKEYARRCLMEPGLVSFHNQMKSIGVPYGYHQGNTVICVELEGDKVSVGDTLYYKDQLQRLVPLKVESIEQEKQTVAIADTGKTGIKVNREVPRNKEIFR